MQDRQCTYNVTLRCVRTTIVAVEKQQIWHIPSVFVALGMQHTNCMRHIVICGLSGSTIFFRLSHKGHDFLKKKVLKMKCAIWFSLHHLSEKVFILRRIQRGIISAHKPSCRVNFISVRFFKELKFFFYIFF